MPMLPIDDTVALEELLRKKLAENPGALGPILKPRFPQNQPQPTPTPLPQLVSESIADSPVEQAPVLVNPKVAATPTPQPTFRAKPATQQAPMPPQGPMPSIGGQFNQEKDSRDNQIKSMQIINRGLTMDPKDIQGLYETWKNTPVVEQQRSGLDALQNRVEELRALAQKERDPFNWKLIAAFGDHLAKSNLAQAIAPQESQYEIEKEVLGLDRAVQKEREDLSKGFTDALKSYKSGTYQEQLMELLGAKMALDTVDPYLKAKIAAANRNQVTPSNIITLEKGLREDINKEVAPVLEHQAELGDLDQKFAKGDYINVASALAKYARYVQRQTGVLSDKDMALAMPATLKTSIARLETWAGQPNPKVDPNVLATMRQAMRDAQGSFVEFKSKVLKAKRDQYQKAKGYKMAGIDVNPYFDDADRTVQNSMPGRKSVPVGTRRMYKGQLYEFTGGDDRQQSNWKAVGK